jgi:hypothetical protein
MNSAPVRSKPNNEYKIKQKPGQFPGFFVVS